MSLKSLIQIIILLIIFIILGSVYFNYFSKNENLSLQQNEPKTTTEKVNNFNEKKETENQNEIKTENDKKKINPSLDLNEIKTENDKKKINPSLDLNEKKERKKPEIKNLVKDIEYLTTDKNGNKYKILAKSGRTNTDDKNILDLDDVRGVITSSKRSTIYIVSDFAEYNSSSLNSKFYQNVVINYEDKEITCDYFDIDMQTNMAIAYNNVVVTDPNSIMKAGKIILNIETKVININPENKKKKVTVITN
tara:strand:+ start:2990 stop:3739 length:750 start_codon:yes stop_codon:yes gene_type:complete